MSAFKGVQSLFKCSKSLTNRSIRRCHATSHMSPELQYLMRGDGVKIAYRRYQPPDQLDSTKPGVIFCSGFQSTMEGVKAMSLEKYCMENGLKYLRLALKQSIRSSQNNSLPNETELGGGGENRLMFCAVPSIASKHKTSKQHHKTSPIEVNRRMQKNLTFWNKFSSFS